MEVVKSKKSSGKHKQRVAEPKGQIPAAPTLDELLKSPGNNETTEEQLIESEIPVLSNDAAGSADQIADIHESSPQIDDENSAAEADDLEQRTQQKQVENDEEARVVTKKEEDLSDEKSAATKTAGVNAAGSSASLKENIDIAEKAEYEEPPQQEQMSHHRILTKDGMDGIKEPTAPSIYPSANQLATSGNKQLVLPQISLNEVTSATENSVYPDLITAAIEEPMSARAMLASADSELLDEQQLLEFYQNEELEFLDDFVDVFIENELEPRNCLYELLAKYKTTWERIQSNEDLKAAKVRETHEVNNRIWTIREEKIIQQGKCNCGRSASGETSYKVAEMHPELLVQLKEAVEVLMACELDVGLCQSVRAGALVLQIQWIICDLRAHFFAEHQLQQESQPILLTKSSGHSSKPSKRAIRGALSDLFYFLRLPMPPPQFRQALTNWTIELGSILLKACTIDDQFFLLSQILRTPSPVEKFACLVQTFVHRPMLVEQRTQIDNFVGMLAMLLQSIRHRERFLLPISKYFAGDNAWNVIDEGGDIENVNMADISESDLILLLGQFPIRPLLNLAFRHFTLICQGHRVQILYSLVSFIGTLLKILDEGLQTYDTMRNFCKKIADIISKILYYFCAYWCLIRTELLEAERRALQNEVNRIVLQAIYYIVSKRSALIRQFLVDLPYGALSENCRLRCQLLMRSPPSRKAPTVSELYAIPDSELLGRVKNGVPLSDQLGGNSRENDDLTYTVSALASVISQSEQELLHFVTEIIDICFLNENSREKFYKIGSEAMATLIDRNPSLLGPVLRYIDRHLDHLDDYAVNILNNVPLQKCTLTAEDVTDRLGKWLIQRPVNNPASAIARRVLTSMNWTAPASAQPLNTSTNTQTNTADNNNGTPSRNSVQYPKLPPHNSLPSELRQQQQQHVVGPGIPVTVHNICAETLVKAHFVHCKLRNSLISKPLSKIARLATKCPDYEQLFDRFCWEVLLKLKISPNPTAPSPPNDLTAFFVHCVQRSLSTPNEFICTGLSHFQELVNSGSHSAAVAILARAVQAFPSQIQLLTKNSNFCDIFVRLLHADDSSISYAAYAISFITGGNKFPGPVIAFLSAAISHQLSIECHTHEQRQQLVLAWFQLLTCPKSTTTAKWNEDKTALYLLGSLVKAALLYDSAGLFGLVDMVLDLYKTQIGEWKESYRGPLSWFSSGYSVHPPLIFATNFHISSWATYLLLCAEQRAFPEFYEQLHQAFGKHPTRSVEECLKKSSSRSHIPFTLDQLAYYRWLQFICADESSELPQTIFLLSLQQLAIAMFSQKQLKDGVLSRTICPGWHYYYRCKPSEPLFTQLRTNILPKMESPEANGGTIQKGEQNNVVVNQSTAPIQCHALVNAFAQWIGTELCYKPEMRRGQDFADLPMSYLLQIIISGDQQVWSEFIAVDQMAGELQSQARLFAQICHLTGGGASNPSSPVLGIGTSRRHRQSPRDYANLTQFFSALDPHAGIAGAAASIDGHQQPFPTVPTHQNLPQPERLDLSASAKSPVGFAALNPFAFDAQSETISRFLAYLGGLNKASKAFIGTKEFVDKSNIEYLDLFQRLYRQFERKVPITLRCGMIQTSRCPKPATTEILVKPYEYQQETADRMDRNRLEREQEAAKLLSTADSLAIISAQLERICWDLNKLARDQRSSHSGDNKQPPVWHVGLNCFYRLCSSVDPLQLLFPAGLDTYYECIRKLGSAFVANNPAEQFTLMRIVIGENPLNQFLVEHFTPHCVQPPEQLAKIYAELSNAVRQPATSETALKLLRRLDIEHAGKQLPPNQFHQLMPVMFENLASVTTNCSSKNRKSGSGDENAINQHPLRQLCMDHFVHAMFHQFPHNFPDGLRLVLSGCDKQCVPSALFKELERRLHIDSLLVDQQQQSAKSSPDKMPEMDAAKAMESIKIISQQFASSRRELNTRLFAVWAPYLESVCRLADFLLRVNVQQTFRPDAPTAAMEKGLDDAFRHAIDVWSPLIEPVPIFNQQHTWGIGDIGLAQRVVNQLIRYLQWLPYTLYIPPDRECPESLFWRYFSTRLVGQSLRSGNSSCSVEHIYTVYENNLTGLNWSRFWPNLFDLSVMDQLLFTPAPAQNSGKITLNTHERHVAPIIVDIVVRLPWATLLPQYLNEFLPHQQPLEATRAFHSLLLSIFAKLLWRRKNYARSRVSMCDKLSFLHDNCRWAYVKAETLAQVGEFLAAIFPDAEEWFNGHNGDGSERLDEAQQRFFSCWRQACHFCTTPTFLPPQMPIGDLEIPRKRAIYVRTQLRILFRTSNGIENKQEQQKHYVELLNKANFMLISAEDKNDYFDMASEFISPWADYVASIPGNKSGNNNNQKKCRAFLDQFYAALLEWLNSNVDSPLVLLFATVGTSALAKLTPIALQRQFGLGIVENCIRTYFSRSGIDQNWREIAQWVRVTDNLKDELFVLSTEPNEAPHFLALNAFLIQQISSDTENTSNLKLLKKLQQFTDGIKPKHIVTAGAGDEPIGLVLCLEKWQRMCIGLFAIEEGRMVPPLSCANEHMQILLLWLHRVYTEDGAGGGSGGFLSMVTNKLIRKTTYSTKLQLFANVMHLFLCQQIVSTTQPPRLRSGQPVMNSRLGAFRDLQSQKAYNEFSRILADEIAPYFVRAPEFSLVDAPQLFIRFARLLWPGEKALQQQIP